MKIKMVGIDHAKAAIEYREMFSFTKSAAAEAVRMVKADFGVSGCVLLSTCNRTELWISYETEPELTPAEMLCKVKDAEPETFESFFVEREGMEAVQHLFDLSCGLKSRVWGEDQIITQVKNAAQMARDEQSIDPVLDRLFRSAVTAAKKVKTVTHLTAVDRSVAVDTANLLADRFGDLSGISCMVIGNGEMGRLTARVLVDRGCTVYMTLRQYHKGEAIIPSGCEVIHYDDRFAYLPKVQVVISATTSPHYTLKLEDILPQLKGQLKIMVDLAVPRDIDPRIADIQNVILYDIDTLSGPVSADSHEEQLTAVREILQEYIKEFEDWYYFRDLIPTISVISDAVAQDVGVRTQKTIKGLDVEPEDRDELNDLVGHAAGKAVSRLLYSLRENLDHETCRLCIEGLAKAVVEY